MEANRWRGAGRFAIIDANFRQSMNPDGQHLRGVAMPKHRDLGYGRFTADKAQAFRAILQMQMIIARAVIQKISLKYTPLPYLYLDLTAGPGYSDPHRRIKGSPLIFLELANQPLPIGRSKDKFKAPVPFEAYFFEKDAAFAAQLETEIAPFQASSYCQGLTVHCADYTDPTTGACRLWTTPQKYRYGLIYVDPSGDLPDFDTLACLAERFPRVEILIHIAAAIVKRRSQAHNIPERLVDLIGKIPKPHWLIRKARRGDKHQWTFLMGTGDNELFKGLKREQFHPVDSPEGRRILEQLNYTQQELFERRQPRLL